MEKQRYSKMSTIGLVIVTPSLLFVLTQLLRYQLGLNFYDPFEGFFSNRSLRGFSTLVEIILFFSPVLAFALSLIPILRVTIRTEESSLVGTIRIKRSLVSFTTATLSLFCITSMLLYAIFENFRIVAR